MLQPRRFRGSRTCVGTRIVARTCRSTPIPSYPELPVPSRSVDIPRALAIFYAGTVYIYVGVDAVVLRGYTAAGRGSFQRMRFRNFVAKSKEQRAKSKETHTFAVVTLRTNFKFICRYNSYEDYNGTVWSFTYKLSNYTCGLLCIRCFLPGTHNIPTVIFQIGSDSS